MLHCSHCGAPMEDYARTCGRCGVAVDDAPGFLWALLSFICPLIGIVFYATKNNTYPSRSGSMLKGAFAGILCGVLVGIVCLIWTCNIYRGIVS